MAGDRALSLLIDIKARDSASSIVRSLGGILSGLGKPFALIAQGAKTAINSMDFFIHGFPATGILNLKKGLADVVKGFEQLAVAALKVIAIFGLIAVAVGIAIGVMAVKAAGDFQQGLNRLVTGAGDVTDNMTLMGQAILGVSIKTGVAADNLNTAMYHILSVGQRGAQALDTLAAASEGAQIEMAKVADVANILVILQTNFGIHTYTATQYMNGLIVAVAHGNITLENLSTAMAPILPLAHQLGISFMDVAAAMSVQTNAGLDARKSATGLQAIFVALENPTAKAAKAMKLFGVDSVAVADEMKRSLPGAFQMLIDAALKVGPVGSVAFNRAMMDMVGGGTRTAKSITALSQNMQAWTADIKQMSAAMHLSTQDVMGWDVASSGFNVQMDKSKAAVQALLIVIGTRLLPILTKFLTQVTPLVTAFAQWVLKTDPLGKAMAWVATAFEKVKGVALAIWPVLVQIGQFLAAVFVPVWQSLVTIFNGMVVPAWKQFVAALQPALPALKIIGIILGVVIVAALMILVFAIGLAIVVIGGFVALLVAGVLMAARFFMYLLTIVSEVVNGIVSFFKWLWHMLVGGSIIPDIVNGAIMWFNRMKSFLVSIVSSIVNGVVNGWNTLKNATITTLAAMFSAWQGKLAQIRSAILSFVAQAISWGVSLVNNFLSGLQSAWNSVVSWVNGALAGLRNLFPHSPVKEGPLKGYENWGYTFGMGIADGIRRSTPAVQSASLLLASSMGGNYSGSYSLSGSSFGGGRYPTGGVTVVHNHIVVMPPDVKLDGASVTDKIMQRAGTDVRRHGGPIKWG